MPLLACLWPLILVLLQLHPPTSLASHATTPSIRVVQAAASVPVTAPLWAAPRLRGGDAARVQPGTAQERPSLHTALSRGRVGAGIRNHAWRAHSAHARTDEETAASAAAAAASYRPADDARKPALWELDESRIIGVTQAERPDEEHSTGAAFVLGVPAASPAYRVRWLPPPLNALPDAPPLLFSVFAEWRMEAEAEASSEGDQKGRKSTRVCYSALSLTSDAADTSAPPVASCVIPAGLLPPGVIVDLRVMAECDYERMRVASPALATLLPRRRCLASLSTPWCISPQRTPLSDSTQADDTPSAHALHPLSQRCSNCTAGERTHVNEQQGRRATPLASSLADPANQPAPTPLVTTAPSDDDLRATLCRFFHMTSGSSWKKQLNWCDDTLPVCRWYGLTCGDSAHPTLITEMRLSNNQLQLANPNDDISFVWASLTNLTQLELGGNGYLGASLNLTLLTRLQRVEAVKWVTPLAPPAFSWLLLPESSQLLDVDVASSLLLFDMRRTPRLQHLYASANKAPWQLASIWHAPGLLTAEFQNSAVNSSDPAPDGSGIAGCDLTQHVLSRLEHTNPLLRRLTFYGSNLCFGATDASGQSNWPNIRAPALTSLVLRELPQLRTPPSGPSDHWLSGMPALAILEVWLDGVSLHTDAFAQSSRHLEAVSLKCNLRGDLQPLYGLTGLVTLMLEHTGVVSTLPENVADVWPDLQLLSISGGGLWGQVPSFAHMADLSMVHLPENALASLPSNLFEGSPRVTSFDVSQNPLTGPMGSAWRSDSLLLLHLFDTSLSGTLSPDLWARFPSLKNIDISGCDFEGIIPAAEAPRLVDTLIMSSNAFVGPLPANISSRYYDVAFNQLSGDLSNLPPNPRSFPLNKLLLAGNPNLSCPMLLFDFPELTHLDIHGTGLAGCDTADPTQWRLPASLQFLDMSDVQREPRHLVLRDLLNLQTLRARGASIHSADFTENTVLAEVALDDNPLRPDSQLTLLGTLITRRLHTLTMDRCGIQLDVGEVARKRGERFWPLQKLSIRQNSLHGDLPGWPGQHGLNEVGVVATAWPQTLSVLLLSSNPRITGELPDAGPGSQMTQLDLTDTAVSGALPESWENFIYLQQLGLGRTNISCTLVMDSNGELNCPLPSWVSLVSTLAQLPVSPASPEFVAGVHCHQLELQRRGLSSMVVDPSYFGLTACTCDSNFFGRDGICIPCPDECTCTYGWVEGCWPVVQQGEVTGERDADGVVTVRSVTPFSILQLLPCASTVSGESLCNPGGEHDWGQFYQLIVVEVGGDAEVSDFEPWSLSDFCYPGHTGRLCAQCESGYFSSGRWCIKCVSEGLHVLIVLVNLGVLLALVLYLYKQQPDQQAALAALQQYRAESRAFAPLPVHSSPPADAGSSYVMRSVSPHGCSPAGEALVVSRDAPCPIPPSSPPASPLRLLVFHSQQLSLLLLTTATLPPMLSGLLAVFSSASSGFSLSSLTAMECLSGWSMAHRCWAALMAPAMVGVVAAIAYAREHFQRDSRGRDPFDTDPAGPAAPSPAAAFASRTYAACMSLLYLLVFPCAQTALSAMACTDRREAEEGLDAGQPSRVYLNLAPWQQCDAQWRSEILPPALLASIFWCLFFPLLSTLWLRRAHAGLMREGSAAELHSSLHTWTVASDLLKPFSPRLPYWEQVLLARRLLLVACVTFVPQHSLYLPLLLLLLIQASALLQHWAHPYCSPWLNAGELASLYLLLLNYLSALVAQAASAGRSSAAGSADAWLTGLFLVNLAFLLVLVCGLFAWVRVRLGDRLWKSVRGNACAKWLCGWRNDPNDADQSDPPHSDLPHSRRAVPLERTRVGQGDARGHLAELLL